MGTKDIAINYIEENKDKFIDVSHKIWGYAELSLQEYKSAKLYIEKFREDGWDVEENLDGIETCFKASYGNGHPIIGILGEFDALSGLSQVGASPVREELVPGGTGHGCGHSMLGAGSMAAAYGIRKYLEETGNEGTIIYFGCPGEEGGASKAFLARDGYWKFLDSAITWHPGVLNEVVSGSSNSCIQKEYTFKGIAAHASGAPHLGRSALDAVQIMNIGVEFLREHMDPTARIHYAILDAGGVSPNVVQPIAKVLYMVRSNKVRDCIALQKRVDKIAEAATMMTETELSVRFIDGLANLVSNKVLEQVAYSNLEKIGVPEYTEEEYAFAKALDDNVENKKPGLPGGINPEDDAFEFVDEASEHGNKALNDFILPYIHKTTSTPGSTDVGDVSWLTPTVQVHTACFVAHAPGHSWQNVSCGMSTIGDKGLIQAAKVLSGTAIDLFENPEIISKAKEEFDRKTKEGFLSPVPEDAVPTII